MAEFKFDCTNCGQGIICDELWTGHQIQCPSCQTEQTVPHNQPAPPAASTGPVAVPTGGAKLSINQGYHASHGPTKSAPIVRNLAPPPPKKKSPLLTYGVPFIVLCGLGVGGYYGWNFWQARAEKARAAEAAAQAAAAQPAADATPAQPPPPKELPIIPAVWTLDVATAKIPEGKANGSISGTNFVVETARLDKAGLTHVLRLRQGAGATADREVLVYLHLGPTEGPTGHTWTVSKEMRGSTVPSILKLWKADPRYAPRQKNFANGYAMKLELGQITDNLIDGKIFLALPDSEQSVVAGLFKATFGVTGDPNQAPAAAPTPTPTTTRDPNFQRRYGVAPGGR